MKRYRLYNKLPKVRIRSYKSYCKDICYYLVTIFLAVVTLTFVILPLIFKYSISLQRLLIFTNVNLPSKEEHYAHYPEPGLRNLYIRINDYTGRRKIFLGVWHLLPLELSCSNITEENFDFDHALSDRNYSVVLYFHGAGEARSYELNMYRVLREFFHVIAFDYRGYADSSDAPLSEDAVQSDCVELYKWLLRKTENIYVWGHSLGSSLAARTISTLRLENILPKGLILESAFTSMKDEVPLHPYGKFFAWLPWFEPTIIHPLQKNKLSFNTEQYVRDVDCPIMILHAMDDDIVPSSLGIKLYENTRRHRRRWQGRVYLHLFGANFKYNHFYIYEAPELPSYIGEFMENCEIFDKRRKNRSSGIIVEYP